MITKYHVKSKNTLYVNLPPKMQCNYSNNNYIPEFLMAYSVIDGEFLLEWYEYFGQP